MFRYIHALLVYFLLCGLGAFAYGQDAQIQGQVSDPTGAAISKALVRVVDQRTGTERKLETNDNGQYTVPGLTPGTYMIYVQAPGFGAAVSNEIALNPGQSAVMDFTLKVGATSADVIVTAEKREERLQDVPVAVTAIDPQPLAERGEVLLRDYYMTVPGLNLTPNIEGTQNINLRGVTTSSFSNPTVGVLIDDVPYGATGGHGGGNLLPDFDPGEFAQIEVLRGPQGTLYGAASMGGLIKFVTTDPSTDRFGVSVSTGISGVTNGAEPGYTLRASANVPIRKTLAVRVSGYDRQDPGYIDDIFTNQKGVNESHADGGRLSLLWLPSDNLSVKLGATYQHIRTNGINEITRGDGEGDLQQNYIAGLFGERNAGMYTADVKLKFGGMGLTSLTGYNANIGVGPFDFTPFVSSQTQAAFGVAGNQLFDKNRFSKVSEEVRLSASLWRNIDWMVGGFYTHEANNSNDTDYAAVPLTGQVVGLGYYGTFPDTYQEYAGFLDLTYHITERLDVQVGARESNIEVDNPPSSTVGPLVQSVFSGPPGGIFNPAFHSTSSAFTYLATARYRFVPDLMMYARAASGYRPGGPNNVVPGVPSQFQPDKTENYELGLKGDFVNHKLSVDADIYYVDWKNIQLALQSPPPADVGYMANGGAAKSEGAELEVNAKPLGGLTIVGWGVYDDAALTQNFPADSTAFGVSGDRLPATSRFSGNLSLEDQFRISDTVTGFVGGNVSYVGDRKGAFTGSPLRQDFPAYTKTDFHADLGYKSWTVSSYVDNVADTCGLLNGGIGYVSPNGYVITMPRTFGVSLSKKF